MKLLEIVNNNPQTVASLSTLNLGNIKHRVCYGAFEYNNIDTIKLIQPGWYLISVKVDLTSTVADQEMSLALYGNGVIVPETETNTFAATIGTEVNLSFTKIAKVCINDVINLTLVNTSADTVTYDDLIIDIVKVN